MIDHARHKRGASARRLSAPDHRAVEHALAPVGVPDPFVQHQDGSEVFQVGNLAKQSVRQKIVNGDRARVAGIARTKLPAGLDRHLPRAHLDGTFRIRV